MQCKQNMKRTITTTKLENYILLSICNDELIGESDNGWRNKKANTWSKGHFSTRHDVGLFGSLCKKRLCWSEGQGQDDLIGLNSIAIQHIESLIKSGDIIERACGWLSLAT